MNNYKKPKISLLMANYNNSEFIGAAIESVINQTDDFWELVVIDDCSTDNSLDVIKKYLFDSRIKLHQNEKNLGKIETLKRLIRISSGHILGILDSDDAIKEKALEEIQNAYLNNDKYGVIYSQFIYCDKKLNELKKGISRAIPKDRSNIHKIYTMHFLTFKKEMYYKTSGFDDEILYAEDMDIILKFEEVSSLFFLDKILYKYRRLPNSQSSEPVKSEISRSSFALAKYKAYQRRLGTAVPNLSKRQMSYQLLNAFPSCLKSKYYKRANFFFFEAIKLYPLNLLGFLMLFIRLIKFPFYRLYKKILKPEDPLYGA